MRLSNPPLEAVADRILAELDARRRVQVIAPPGAGRGALVEKLQSALGSEAVIAHLPPLNDPDAPLHGLFQVASSLGREDVERATQDAILLENRAQAQARRLVEELRVLIVWVPSSTILPDMVREPGTQLRLTRAKDLLRGWLSEPALRTILLFSHGSQEFVRQADGSTAEWGRVDLPLPRLTPGAFDDVTGWETYAEAAEQLGRELRRRPHLSPTPLEARLLVGLAALGEQVTSLLDWLASPTRHPLALLENRLRRALDRSENEGLRQGIARFLQARFPLPRAVALKIASLPSAHVPLLTECIGQGGDMLRPNEALRLSLLQSLGRDYTDSAAHLAIADHHEALDGAACPVGAFQNIRHWLEKVHHLGHAGAAGAARWSALDLPTRELYWDRARSLSVEHHDHLGAAELYRQCIRRFDDRDAYAWHYLGYNLDRAGESPDEAERAFRKAVELRPDHPWYNGRLVTFLIDQRKFDAAELEWRKALERVDPSGENVQVIPWLSREMHVWVVKAWLRCGKVRQAREAFDDIPSSIVDDDARLSELRLDLEEALDAEAAQGGDEGALARRQTALADAYPDEYVVLLGDRLVAHTLDVDEAFSVYEAAWGEPGEREPVVIPPLARRQLFRPVVRGRGVPPTSGGKTR